MKQYIVTSGKETRYEITLAALSCGNDFSVTLTGGTHPHVGAVALACGIMPDGTRLKYSASVSSMLVLDHKDDIVARKVAKMIADEVHANVTVTAGIHIDNATEDDLQILQENCMQACRQFLAEL